MANISVNAGTEKAVATDQIGTINYQVVKLDMGTLGVSNPFSGTLPMLSDGTITTLKSGTIKQDGRTARDILSYGTTFSGTAAAYGTLIGSAAVGAGTSIWVNNVSIINSGTTQITAMVGFGTALNGTSVLAKGAFGTLGGIEKDFPLPVNAGMTNQDLVCYTGGAGTIDVNVSYFISA